ncbi:MAG: cadmium-translocating P-type ATPase, partial [Bacteroidetes bacterium]
DMNVLMSTATLGAMAIGKWEEGAVVMLLFALSELLEQYSLRRSRNAIHSLMKLTPDTVQVVRGNETTQVNVHTVSPGERIIIRPGERIPLDGEVVSGSSNVNQAHITGESKPVAKRIGDSVFAGSTNEQGALELLVTKRHNDTMLARIIRLVEEAQSSRAPIHSLVDRFAGIYTPVVFAVACVIAIVPPLLFAGQGFFDWFYRALVLLVIACPCALVLSTPVTIMSGLANAARHGVLIKGGKFLETLGSIKAVAFDKTGTLTKAQPHVTDIIPLNSLSEHEIIKLAALVESRSEHHLAIAVQQHAKSKNLIPADAVLQSFESLTGKGVKATIDGNMYVVGSHALMEEMNICSPEVELALETLEEQGKSTIVVAREHEVLGVIAIADEIRPESRDSIRRLHAAGVEKVIMLTGDNRATAAVIAQQAGIDEVESEILPHEKASHVLALKERYGTIAMVGDGINDAPALAAATVGIAMGKAGTDVALEAADIALMSDDLTRLPYVMKLSRQTVRIIKQNIVIALATKAVVMVLSLFGAATLWMAIVADDGATLAVILNGLRMLRFKQD